MVGLGGPCALHWSGKTAAFLFPMIAAATKGEHPMTEPEFLRFAGEYGGRGSVASPSSLVLAPTRELAEQIHDEAKKFLFGSKCRAVVLYGGGPVSIQLNELSKGCALLIATPGRLLDVVERGRVLLSQVKYFCLDEADRMLDMGFEPDVRKISAFLPERTKRITFMFSATFPREIRLLADEFLNIANKVFIKIGRVGSTTDNIKQELLLTSSAGKKEKLLEVLTEARDMKGTVLVFVERKQQCQLMGEALYSAGFAVASIHGDRQQAEREIALEAFKNKQINILVATSVAARGLDIDHITHVVNYDCPKDIDEYVHRIGRTGRLGKAGKAITFLTTADMDNSKKVIRLHKILVETKQPIPEFILSRLPQGPRGGKAFGRGGRRFPRGGGMNSRAW